MGRTVPSVDMAVLADGPRLAAARQARRILPGLPIPLDAIARLAARFLGAPMAIVAIMDVEEEHFVGSYGLPPPLDTQEPVPVAYSLCKYIVSADHPVIVDDMTADPDLAGHALAVDFGARAFAGVPLRDAADHTIGSLLVVDTVARCFTDADVTSLVEISTLLAGPAGDAIPTDAAVVQELDRRETEREAGAQRGFLRALLDSLDTGVISVDADGRPIVCNRALLRMHGVADTWTPEQLFGLYAERVRRPDGEHLPLEMSPLSRALRGETVRDHEILIRVAGEHDHLFSGNAQPVMGADGRRLGAVLALHEVTERRRAERFRDCQLAVAAVLADTGSLQSAAPEVTRAVATALNWPYVELHLIDKGTGAIRLAGHHGAPPGRWDAVAGRPITKGHGISGSLWATAAPLAVADLRDTRHLVPTARPEADLCLRAGLRAVIALPIHDGDRLVGVLACFAAAPERDPTPIITLLGGITEQLGRFLAKLLAERLGLEVARSKSDFLTLVGHEVRTPLTSISSFIEMLMDETGPPASAEDLRHLMRGIARNTASLCDIVDELLDLAGLELGHQALNERPIDLAEIARQALNDAQPDAGRNHITLTARITENLVTVGDPARLRQALNHLLSNALKYSRGGDLVRLALDHDDHFITVTVTDTGLGIPPDEYDHLFERFYRASNVRHHGIAGTGLGLPLVRAIVEAHHGTVTLGDPATPGTTVTVRIPVRPTPAGSGKSRRRNAPNSPAP
jgi:PAS domain S-box-containing protein